MTLDEAIIHAEEVAAMREDDAVMYAKAGLKADVRNCYECAAEHRQLAEWLKDYKQLLTTWDRTIAELERLKSTGEYGYNECSGISEAIQTFKKAREDMYNYE